MFPCLHLENYGTLKLIFSSNNLQGNFFIKPSFESNLFDLADKKISFLIQPHQSTEVEISINAIKRGYELIHSLYVESLFPFGLFRCFTFFPINQACYVYPKRENLKLHDEILTKKNNTSENDEFYLRNFVKGDSFKRVDWKKLAQKNIWYTRQFQTEEPSPVMLMSNHLPNEETLKSVCFALYELHQNNIPYGIKLENNVFIEPQHSQKHLTLCLRELALYET
jgi:uncharacterized protein (DUF58 family)